MSSERRITVKILGQPPSGNHMYERQRGGKQLRKREGVEIYQNAVTTLVRDAMNKDRYWRPDERVVVEFYFYLSTKVDATNAMKVIEDGIGEALCNGDRPPMCCRAFDDRFLCRAMTLQTGYANPFVLLSIWNQRLE